MSTISAAALSLDPATDIRRLTEFPFMVNALEAGAIVAIVAGVVGWFMVLRAESFAGHTLSVMAFPGATGALLVGLPATVGFFGFCGCGALLIGAAGRSGRAQESAVTGAIQTVGLACGFMFLSLYHGVLEGYENLLFGSFLGITSGRVLLLGIVALAVLALLALAGRPLLFASIDEHVARAHGVPARALGSGFLLALGLAVAATAQITGALLVFALLVAPAATARAITLRVGPGIALSAALGVLTVWTGLACAYFSDYPVGFFVTTIALVLYALARGARALADRPAAA